MGSGRPPLTHGIDPQLLTTKTRNTICIVLKTQSCQDDRMLIFDGITRRLVALAPVSWAPMTHLAKTVASDATNSDCSVQ